MSTAYMKAEECHRHLNRNWSEKEKAQTAVALPLDMTSYSSAPFPQRCCKALLHLHQTTRCHIAQQRNLYSQHCEREQG